MELWADHHGDVIIHTPDSHDFLNFYHNFGYYGSRTEPTDPSRCAFLSAFEAQYLHDNGLLPTTHLPTQTRQAIESDLARYQVYSKLRQAGWTVRSGLQYGGDFLLYRGAPGQEHAPYVVIVQDADRGGLTGMMVAGLVRAAAGARKQMVLASADGTVTVLNRWVPEQERMR